MTKYEYNQRVAQLYRDKVDKEMKIANKVFKAQGFEGLLKAMLVQAKEMVYQCENLINERKEMSKEAL